MVFRFCYCIHLTFERYHEEWIHTILFGGVKGVKYSNHQELIIVDIVIGEFAFFSCDTTQQFIMSCYSSIYTDVYCEWIIIVHGLIIVLDSITTTIFILFTFYAPVTIYYYNIFFGWRLAQLLTTTEYIAGMIDFFNTTTAVVR